MVYRWCRAGRVARSKIHFEGGSNSVTNGIPNGDRVEDHVEDSEAIVYAPSVADSRWDSSQSISPLTSGGGVPRATSDERPQSEFRDPGEQNDHERVGFSAKEQHEDRGPVDYSDSSEMEEEMFRAGVEQMGRRIAEIELRLQMVQLDIDSAPPGYSSDGPLIGAQSHMRPS
ncbi:hypothetical protein BDZ94DRAFT_1250233 [Collybia nuda]|uniref:Uncharacterized protein n=1 Tax=Collybia nuda TaxID=64659 RepID=A0A9P5YBC1_9AGAR|nr:hypothetical protein BDZ94DRAFT_1250233 [Collybia nuda]